MIINSNLAALNTYNKLNKSQNNLRKSLERLSSGKRINKAADDAAGSAISQKMGAQSRGTAQAQRNVQDGVSMIQTADEGLDNIMTPPLKTMRDLAVQAANDTYTDEDRKAMQDEFDQMKASIDDIANNTEFNTKKLLAPPKVDDNFQPVTGKADIVFVVDNTGSMGPKQEEVKNNIVDFITEINSKGVDDIRMGLVKYSDDASIHNFAGFNWTSDIQEMEDSLMDLTYYTSPSAEENAMNAISETIDNYNFRDNEPGLQNKHIILLTNEGAEDESEYNSTLQKAIDNEVQIHGIIDIDDDKNGVNVDGIPYTGKLNDLIDQTNGGKIDIQDNNWGDEISSKLGAQIGESGSSGEELEMEDLILQTAANSDNNFEIELTDARTENLGITNLSIETREDAEKAISEIDEAMSTITSERGKFGSYQNRLKHTSNNLSNYGVNLEASKSRIEDADIAKEMVEMSKQQIMSQAGTAMLTQANQLPQGALQLLQ